jgi:outer membrane protein assembly factor BamD (BamD/ComL family)
VIEQIDSAFAKKVVETAEYYERVHEWRGAVYQYRFLIQTYPASPEAALARVRLTNVPAQWLREPPPPSAPGYWPTTQPAVSADAR